jgi:hypothetical protein
MNMDAFVHRIDVSDYLGTGSYVIGSFFGYLNLLTATRIPQNPY